MPILGVIASSVSGNLWPANSFESIATITAAGGETTISFTGIPSTYKHLQLRGIARDTFSGSSGYGTMYLRFNSDTGNNYNWAYSGTNTALNYGSAANDSKVAVPSAFLLGGTTAGYYGTFIIDIYNYSNTNLNTTVKHIAGADAKVVSTSYQMNVGNGNWNNTAAVTSIQLPAQGTAWAQYSSFALYGIKG